MRQRLKPQREVEPGQVRQGIGTSGTDYSRPSRCDEQPPEPDPGPNPFSSLRHRATKDPQRTAPPLPVQRLLTAADAADRLNLSLRSVRRMIKDGRLPIVRLGRTVRIRPEALEKLIAASE